MEVTQYIGARYVPILADPAAWSSEKSYEPLTIVTYQGNSYTSRQFVPVGMSITNEHYWALTGNYNAQVEQYRQEVSRVSSQISEVDEKATSADEKATAADEKATAAGEDASTALVALGSGWGSENTVRSEIDAITGDVDAIGDSVTLLESSMETAQGDIDNIETTLTGFDSTNQVKSYVDGIDAALEKRADVANIVDTLYGKIKCRDVAESSYLYSNPVAPTWCTIQGLCYTKNGKYAGLFAPSLEYYRTHVSQYFNTCVLKEFNADGTLYRQSQPLNVGHGNSITYNAANDEFVIATNYYINSTTFEREASSTVMVYEYSTLVLVATYDYSNWLTGTANGVSYDDVTETLMVFDGDDFKGIYINPETYEYISSVDISCFQNIYQETWAPFDASRRQSITHTKDYIVFAFYMPNMFAFATRDNEPQIVKIMHNYDEFPYELEDFDINANGDIIYGGHRRFYTRNTEQEVVMNLYTVYESNIYTNGYPFDFADKAVNTASRYIYVNPNTTNIIQNGSENCPCKTVMEAYFLYGSRHYSAGPLTIVIPADAGGKVKFVRLTDAHMTIDCNSENVTFVTNARFTHGTYILDNVDFVDDSSPDCVKYPFSANGDISFLYSTAWLIGCSLYESARAIELNNCVYIGSNDINVNPRNHYLYNAPGQSSIANGFGGPV